MEANKYKIGIIGSRDIILPFSMIGFDIFPAYQEQEA
ncbi:V-type ATP synthase subunit F, partial [Streptococcus pneumoniae]|nr:V-type ATP synthase subunit F [Streptococcus pneumoniae]